MTTNYTQAYNVINSKFDILRSLSLKKLFELQKLAPEPKKEKTTEKREYTEQQLSFGMKIAEQTKENIQKLKVELIKFYYNSTDEELEEINAIIEYPLLWGRIENELPHILNFFNLSELENKETSTTIQ